MYSVRLFDVEAAYVVTLIALREICEALSRGEVRYWIEEEAALSVTIGFNNPEYTKNLPNDLLYSFPIISRNALLDDGGGTVVCIHPSAVQQPQRGLYIEGNEVRADVGKDWEAFWTPFAAELLARLDP